MSLTDAMRKSRLMTPAPDYVGADIFISYSHPDLNLAAAQDRDLRGEGYRTWWAAHLVGGDTLHTAIIAAIDSVRAVVVIWTPASTLSQWVYSEALRAHSQNKLVPVRTHDLAVVQIPPPFSTLLTLDFDDRSGLASALGRLGVRPRRAA